MKLPIVAVAVAGLLATACGSEPSSVAALVSTGAWARTTPPGATNGVVYLQITSPSDDAIVDVAVPPSIAASAELHETMGGTTGAAMPNMPNMDTGTGQMTMTPIDSVALPAQQTVAFEPGGNHIMLVDLVEPLRAGDHVTLTVVTDSGKRLDVDVVVADNAP